MAHYRFIVFLNPEKNQKRCLTINRNELLDSDGFIYDGEIFSLDTLRWMLPEMGEERRRETFKKLLQKKLKEADEKGLDACIVDYLE